MEQIEPLDAELAESDAVLATVVAERAEVEAALAAGEALVDAELAEVTGARADLVAQVPEGLLAEYERLRPSMGGVAVAKLVGATCQGCFLSLAAAEVDEIKRRPADAVIHCPDCGRLLVR
jgi:predicted  nucleic acid-binding Zn-ribbon protein